MTGNENGKNPGKPKQSSAANSRDARLAAALRENLRRRKAQERARGADERARGAGEQGRGSQDGPGSDPAAGDSSPGDENP